jgi:hypothetical protein
MKHLNDDDQKQTNKKLRNSTPNMIQRLNKQYQDILHDTMIMRAQESSKSELRFKSYKGLKVIGTKL